MSLGSDGDPPLLTPPSEGLTSPNQPSQCPETVSLLTQHQRGTVEGWGRGVTQLGRRESILGPDHPSVNPFDVQGAG